MYGWLKTYWPGLKPHPWLVQCILCNFKCSLATEFFADLERDAHKTACPKR